ncbi:MAG: hypothetical protein JWL62_1313 [Hyphomicrobiales bacterium]|nr:hypothetical protein [Hyphomicrobiales bacterium]
MVAAYPVFAILSAVVCGIYALSFGIVPAIFAALAAGMIAPFLLVAIALMNMTPVKQTATPRRTTV